MCELLVGLPDVTVLAVDDQPGQPIADDGLGGHEAHSSIVIVRQFTTLADYRLRIGTSR
jgi:hypothetical protein